MSIETIASGVVSVLALMCALLTRPKHPKVAKTLEQISKEAQQKAQKYMIKQCTKNGIKVEENVENETKTNN